MGGYSRAAKLEPKVAGEPRGRHHVYLFADVHRIGGDQERHRGLSSRRRRRALQQAPQPRVQGRRRRGRAGIHIHHEGGSFDNLATLNRSHGTDLPAPRPECSKTHLDHGCPGGPSGERDLRAFAARNDLESVDGCDGQIHGIGGMTHRPHGEHQLLAHRYPVLIDRDMELRTGYLK